MSLGGIRSGRFLDYLGRCQRLLQEGQFVADVLYYTGDWAPNIVPPKHVDPSLGSGFDYDACNAEVLLTRLSVKDGRVVLPDGMSYRLLVLPESTAMPVEVVAKIRKLVKAGATVAGPKPARDSGLKNFHSATVSVQKIAGEIWGDCDGRKVTKHAFGKGRVFWGVSLREILSSDGVQPDFEHSGGEAFIDFIHRSAEGYEIYFVANRNNRAEVLDCTFRVSGRQPEIWDPVSGEIKVGGCVSTRRGADELAAGVRAASSLFVVFRGTRAPSRLVKAGNASRNFPKLSTGPELTGPWTVKLIHSGAGPNLSSFRRLKIGPNGRNRASGITRGRPDTRNGLIWMRKLGRACLLIWGKVRDVAEVRLNGRKLGIVWTARGGWKSRRP